MEKTEDYIHIELVENCCLPTSVSDAEPCVQPTCFKFGYDRFQGRLAGIPAKSLEVSNVSDNLLKSSGVEHLRISFEMSSREMPDILRHIIVRVKQSLGYVFRPSQLQSSIA